MQALYKLLTHHNEDFQRYGPNINVHTLQKYVHAKAYLLRLKCFPLFFN